MKIHLLILLLFSAIDPVTMVAQQTDEPQIEKRPKLDMQIEEVETSLVNLDGIVKERNKYSFEIDTGAATYKVKIEKDTRIKLRVSSPRIDLEKKQLIIDVDGADKRYRGYPVPDPLFIKINFVHQKQIQRVAAQSVKRIADFELLAQKAKLAENSLSWIGELKKGESNRQLKLKLKNKEYDVLLGKRGTMSGFSISDLKPAMTAVQVSGRLGNDSVVTAKEILFWPSAGHKKQQSPAK